MKPDIEALQDSSRYELLEVWDHGALVAHVQAHLRKGSVIRNVYYALSILTLMALGMAFGGQMAVSGVDFFDMLGSVGMGIIVGYLLIIPHEHIHALAYRYLGAKDVRIHYNLRQLTALCVADRDVVSGKDLVMVAVAPFVVISLLLLLALVFVPNALVVLGALAFHTAACSGDAAIVNFVWLRRSEEILTYDDDREKRTYFFRLIGQS